MKSRSPATTCRLPPPDSSDATVTDRPRSIVSPSVPAWIAPCDIRVILFASKIKHRQLPPPFNLPFKLEVIFCARGVMSPVLANLSLHYGLDRWTKEYYPDSPFEHYADDAICHYRSEAQTRACICHLRRANWNCTRKRRRSCAARTRVDTDSTRTRSSTSWATRFARGVRSIGTESCSLVSPQR
jgi:hypothetical protein